ARRNIWHAPRAAAGRTALDDDALAAASAALVDLESSHERVPVGRALLLADRIARARAEGLAGLAAQGRLLRSLVGGPPGDQSLHGLLVAGMTTRLEELAEETTTAGVDPAI